MGEIQFRARRGYAQYSEYGGWYSIPAEPTFGADGEIVAMARGAEGNVYVSGSRQPDAKLDLVKLDRHGVLHGEKTLGDSYVYGNHFCGG